MTRVGQVFNHPAADDGIIVVIGIGQPRQIRRQIMNARTLEVAMGSFEHALGKIEGAYEGIRISVAEDMTAMPAIAATRIQYAFAAAQVERRRLEHLAGKHAVAGKQAGYSGQIAGKSVILMLNECAVFDERLLAKLF